MEGLKVMNLIWFKVLTLPFIVIMNKLLSLYINLSVFISKMEIIIPHMIVFRFTMYIIILYA